jgi:mitogen-activated protein kinase kinase kinase 7
VSKRPSQLCEFLSFCRQLIGRGTFGLVFKGAWNGRSVAIKQIVGENERLSFTQEVAHLSRVNHENIIKCYGYSLQHVLLVVEYADCGSLHQLLHTPRNRSVQYNVGHALSWALQCARGVEHLHSMKPKPIVHRDLKPLK